jgi:hypothetical protein
MTKGFASAFTIEFCPFQTDRPVSRSHSHISLALECLAPVSCGPTSAPTIIGTTIRKRRVPFLTHHESTAVLHHNESEASSQLAWRWSLVSRHRMSPTRPKLALQAFARCDLATVYWAILCNDTVRSSAGTSVLSKMVETTKTTSTPVTALLYDYYKVVFQPATKR